MTQQWHSLVNEPWPETKDHPFPSSELVMPPFSQNPWLQELEMDVTIRRNLETAVRSGVLPRIRTDGSPLKEHAQEKKFSSGLSARRLGEEHYPHRRHERKGITPS